jgi:protein TonB
VNLETPEPVLATSEPAAPDVTQPAEPISSPAPIPQTAGAASPASNASRAPEALATSGQSTDEYSAEAADAGLLERYRLALIDTAKRYKRYPSRAMEKGWQGRVEIRLVVGSDGTIRNTVIKRSSSYQILDDQALDMVKKSARAEPIPSALRGREFTLDIPVIFELQAG